MSYSSKQLTFLCNGKGNAYFTSSCLVIHLQELGPSSAEAREREGNQTRMRLEIVLCLIPLTGISDFGKHHPCKTSNQNIVE